MLKPRRRSSAQSVGEYSVAIALAMIAITGMTYFIQRGLAARINDTRGYMMRTLQPHMTEIAFNRLGVAWDPDPGDPGNGGDPSGGTTPPVGGWGGLYLQEYEPYYQGKSAQTRTDPTETIYINGKADFYTATTQGVTQANIVSKELPAAEDDTPEN